MKKALLIGLFTLLPSAAFAGNIAQCEVVLLETIEDEGGRGGAKVASYRPAGEFMASVYDDDIETLYKIDDLSIQAVMCQRADIIPSDTDAKIIATGIPFFLTQSFEAQETDLVSVFFKDGKFRYSYKGPGLSEETQALLESRLVSLNEMEHDLDEKEAALIAKKSEPEKESEEGEEEEKSEEEDSKQSTKENKASLEEPTESE